MKITAAIVGILMLTSSCSPFQESGSHEEAMVEVDLMKFPPGTASTPSPQAAALPDVAQVGKQKIERKIIRRGSLEFETNDAVKTRQLIDKSIVANKGYVSKDEVVKGQTQIHYSLTVRVPAEKFDVLLESISKSTSSFVDKKIDAEDVTEEYIDVEARLRTKKELESRYKVLLQRASNVQEILSIEKEMGTLRTEIESIEGRFRYLSDRIAFSTVQIHYSELTGPSTTFLSQFGSAFRDGWNNLLTFLLTMMSVWPFVLLGVLLVIGINSFRRSRTKRAIQGLQS